MNRRIPNGTYGGVRGRGANFSPPTRLSDKIERIYIHVPFCSTKCGYCAFHSLPLPEPPLIEAYFKRLKEEMLEQSSILSNLQSIYIGGGTPSYLDEARLKELFSIAGTFSKADGCEISIECNPESLNKSKIKLISSFANRVSIGVQSFNSQHRKTIGREGEASSVMSIISSFKDNGLKNLSCDLIYGIPRQSQEDFFDDLDCLLSAGINHFSAYSLTIEENSRLDGTLSESVLEEIDETSSEIWNRIPERVQKYGIFRYEVSNYAKKGYECNHNYATWFGAPYLGFGPTASSFDGKQRWTNPPLEGYLKTEKPEIDDIIYSRRVLEVFSMGLRSACSWLISIMDNGSAIITSCFGYSFRLGAEEWRDLLSRLGKLESEGLITIERGCETSFSVRSTEKGLAFWNHIALEII